jgi:ABC-type multidrug transport system fused ATPase/permease subunit
MDLSGGLSSGAMLALAAGLWLVYLIPTWLRRREYLATERNAVRLQQTLRILAESAEQQLADAVERAREAAVARQLGRQLAQAQPALAAVVNSRTRASRRLRRTRAVTSAVFFASVIALVAQVVLLATTGMAAGTAAVLVFAAVGSVTSFAMLGRLASISRARTAALVQQPVQRPERRSAPAARQAPAPVAEKQWTPVPVPKPLYLSRPVVEPVVIVADEVAAELRQAAAAAERARRAAEAAPVVEPIPITRPSRFAAMGIVDESPAATPDLDAVLRRRRTAS